MKKFVKRAVAGFLLLALICTGEPEMAAAAGQFQAFRGELGWPDDSEYQEAAYAYIYDFDYQAYSSTSLTLSWMSGGNNTGFYVYRKCNYDSEFQLLGKVKNQQYARLTFRDSTFQRGIVFTYRIAAYQQDATTGEETELSVSVQNAYLYKLSEMKFSSAKRSGGKKAVLKWKKAAGAKGYEIYRKNSGGKYKLARRIGSNSTQKWTARGLSGKKATYFKIRAYVKYRGKYVRGEFGDSSKILSLAEDKIARKFLQMQKKFPDGRYWNHKGKTKWNSSTTTNRPCVHYSAIASSCNYYKCPNGVIGYQCYGFVWKISDLIYGRKAKIKNFHSFKKCKMGDVVRYGGHSVIITEKRGSYVVVGECNAGNTCVISWGRKVYKQELSGALYSRRY